MILEAVAVLDQGGIPSRKEKVTSMPHQWDRLDQGSLRKQSKKRAINRPIVNLDPPTARPITNSTILFFRLASFRNNKKKTVMI